MPTRRSLSLRIGDYRRVLIAALESHDGPIALMTVTAPGEIDPEWNRTAAQRWGQLHRRASDRATRITGVRPRPVLRIAQRQHRGADHLHVGLDARPQYRCTNAAYIAALKELGSRWGFGFIDDPYFARHPKGKDGRPNMSLPKRDMVYENPAVAGYYLTRYLTESSQLPALITSRDHSFRAIWVSPDLTRKSGVIMRRLRRVRHAWYVRTALVQGSRPRLPVWWGDMRERSAVLQLLRVNPALAP